MDDKAKTVAGPVQDGEIRNESHYHSKKDRVFVRGIQGAYSLKDELSRLRAMPRVRKGSQIKFNDGPQAFSRHYVEPKDGITQTFHIHLEEYGPGGHSQKHGHVNEAAFYILDGEGLVGRGSTWCWNSMFMNMYMGLVLITSARAGLVLLALKCWCTQLLCTMATSPAFQS